MRERMEEMNRQMQGFVDYVRTEMLSRMQQQQPSAGLVPIPRAVIVPQRSSPAKSAAPSRKSLPPKGAILNAKSATESKTSAKRSKTK
jgi:MerR family transcriptional regulator/heat shock protein HspR